MKKTTALLLAALLLLGLFAGCKNRDFLDITLPEYVPIPDLTDPQETTEAPREFPISIAEPGPIPEITPENDLTPAEFSQVLLVENRSPFTSQYMECDPENFERRHDVYALGVTNISDKTIDNLILTYNNGEQDLIFHVEMLPAGWTVVPMDMKGTAVTSTELTYVSGQVNYLTEGRELTDEVELTETLYSTIIVKNMTGEEMPAVVVYYRDVDYLGNVMAGRCFSTTSMELIPGWSEELETEQWLPSCVIVNVVLLDEAPEDGE